MTQLSSRAVKKRPASCLTARLHHLALESPAPERLALFYNEALGYETDRVEDAIMASAQGRHLIFLSGDAGVLRYAAFAVEDQAELDRLKVRLEQGGGLWDRFDDAFLKPGAIVVEDPDGNQLVFGIPVKELAVSKAYALSARLQHVVLGSPDAQAVAAFLSEVVGFTLSDTVLDSKNCVRTSFLRCSEEHHSIAVFQTETSRLDHHCYETQDWNGIRDWADHLAHLRIPLKWGPGRHGPGNNLFIFIHDPDGNWVELSAELETVDHARPAGEWPHEERTLNSWGHGLLRS